VTVYSYFLFTEREILEVARECDSDDVDKAVIYRVRSEE